MSTIRVAITGSNVARDNHWEIPSGSLTPVRTLLIEAGPRNNRRVSESIHFTGSVWSFTNVTRTASFAEAPDGTQTATFIKENTANGFHYSQITARIGTNTLTGLSIFLKPAGRTRFYVGINDTFTGNYAVADVTLTGTGTVNGTLVNGTAAIPSIRIVPYSGSWYRIDTVVRAASFGNPAYQVQLHNGTSTSYTGNGTSGVYMWGYTDGDWNTNDLNGMAPTMFIRGEGEQSGSRDRDVIYWTAPTPQPMTVYARGVVQGNTGVTSERKIIQLGNYAIGGVHAGISTNGAAGENTVRTQFISNYRTVTSTVTPSTGIRAGDPIELSMRLYRTGSGVGTQISYALNGGPVQVGNTSSIASGDFEASWNVINSMSLCTSDVFTQYSQAFAFRNILLVTGSKSLGEMRTLAGIERPWEEIAYDTIPTRASNVNLSTTTPDGPLNSGWTAYSYTTASHYLVMTYGSIKANIANPVRVFPNVNFNHNSIRLYANVGRLAIDRTSGGVELALLASSSDNLRLRVLISRSSAGGSFMQLQAIDSVGTATTLATVVIGLGTSGAYTIILQIDGGIASAYYGVGGELPFEECTLMGSATLPSYLSELDPTARTISLNTFGSTLLLAEQYIIRSLSIRNKVL